MQRKLVGSAAARDGGDAEHRGCLQQQHCCSTCPQPNTACTVPLHSGYCPFPMYAEVAAVFLAGLTVLLSSSGSRRLLLPGEFCTLCSLTWSYEYLFFPGLVGCFFSPSLILNTSYLGTLLRLCPMIDAKLQ